MKYIIKFYKDNKPFCIARIMADSESESEDMARNLFDQIAICNDYTVHKK